MVQGATKAFTAFLFLDQSVQGWLPLVPIRTKHLNLGERLLSQNGFEEGEKEWKNGWTIDKDGLVHDLRIVSFVLGGKLEKVLDSYLEINISIQR